MTENVDEPRIKWRAIYGGVLLWLVVMILLMFLFGQVFS